MKLLEKRREREDGFTIVELLIVIVIIGILAALVIVSYTGIQNRARAVQYKTDVQALIKKAEAYAAASTGNTYPITAAGTDAATVTSQTVTGTLATSLMNGLSESKLPSGLAVFAVVPYATVPSYTQTLAGINASTTIDYYFTAYCATGKGMIVYYPDPTDSTVKSATAGTCP